MSASATMRRTVSEYKVTWSVPLIQYAECKSVDNTVDYDPLAEPERFGADYARWAAAAMKGFEEERSRIAEESRVAEAVRRTEEKAAADELSQLGQEIENEAAKEVIENELGPTTDVSDAPWDEPAPTKNEPWKNQGPVRKPAKIKF